MACPIHPPMDGLREWLEGRILELERGTSRIAWLYGTRVHPVTRQVQHHNGIDLGAPRGTPIKAVCAGRVDKVWTNDIGGIQVRLDHDGLPITGSGYAHLDRLEDGLKPGDVVQAGQVIGYCGSSGRSTGPHLHLVLRSGSRTVDPLPWLLWSVGLSELPRHIAGEEVE